MDRRDRAPRPADTAVDGATLEKWALAYLGRYASSADNLRRILRRRVRRRIGEAPEAAAAAQRLVDDLVARYREAGLLDDAAYAAGRARRGLARGHSPRRIAAGLAAKGIEASDAAAAIAGLREGGPEPGLVSACAFARRRRLGPFRTGVAERQRELAAFARAGFDRRTAERILACADEEAVAGLLADGEP